MTSCWESAAHLDLGCLPGEGVTLQGVALGSCFPGVPSGTPTTSGGLSEGLLWASTGHPAVSAIRTKRGSDPALPRQDPCLLGVDLENLMKTKLGDIGRCHHLLSNWVGNQILFWAQTYFVFGNGWRRRLSTHDASSCPLFHPPIIGAQLVPQMRVRGCLCRFVPALRTGPASLSGLRLLLATFILASAGATYRRPLWPGILPAGGCFATAGRGAQALGPLTFAPGPADILKVTAPRPAYFGGFTLCGCLSPPPAFVARSGGVGNTSKAWPGCVWGWGVGVCLISPSPGGK